MATAYETTRQIERNFYVDGGEDASSILKQMEEHHNQYISQVQAFWNEARIDQRFLAGDQSLFQEIYSNIPANRRRQFNFNRLRRVSNMITGHQRKHRKSTIIRPIEGSDEQTAQDFTDIISWAYGRDNVYNTISDAFDRGAITTGFSLLNIWLDRSIDPASGDLKVKHKSYNSFIMDTFFRNHDLSDCGFVWTREWVTKKEAARLLPERGDEIMAMSQKRYGNKDQRFYYMPENYNYTIKDLLAYDEYYYQTTRKQKILYDTKTGETMEWQGEKDNLKLFMAQYPEVKVQTIEKPTVNLAIVLNNQVMYDGPNLLGIDRYPFVPVIGYWDPDNIYFMWRFQGVVRGLRDAQYLYNRRKAIELDILESQVNSGWKVMEGSLVDNNDVFKSGQGQPIFIKATAPLGMDSAQQIMSPGIQPSVIQLSEILAREINEISGINEELLGVADDDKAGILSMLRQGAGLVTLQKLFDQLDLSQKLLGEISLETIQKNFTIGKIKRILGREPSPQFQDKNFGRYDCTICEGLLTDDQQKLEFLQYMNMQQMGIPIPPDLLIDKAPIQGKKELKEAIQKQQQQEAEVQQEAQKLQLESLQTENMTKQAFSQAQMALASERMAKVQIDRAEGVERLQRAKEDETGAVLNLVKALKELQGMDLTHLMQKVQILNELEGKTEVKTPKPEKVA
jgi:hypothetical protein